MPLLPCRIIYLSQESLTRRVTPEVEGKTRSLHSHAEWLAGWRRTSKCDNKHEKKICSGTEIKITVLSLQYSTTLVEGVLYISPSVLSVLLRQSKHKSGCSEISCFFRNELFLKMYCFTNVFLCTNFKSEIEISPFCCGEVYRT